MSEPATPARPFYVTGGTLKPGEPSYVERRADTDLYESLLAGEFCYVLTARQMGKSSLMARTAKRLEQTGVASAIVDLTQIGSERGDQAAAQWYFGIANVIHRQLGIALPLRHWWQERADLSSVQRLTDFFRELVLAEVSGRVVIFVDEIDSTIGLPFADDFFAALRACFNARATDGAFERLIFVLLGVATPDQLIRDSTRTPFNIGKRIDLTDFRSEEAQVLASGLHSDPEEADRRLGRVLHWTGGHPYLTQALCRAVRDRGETGAVEEAVDPQVEELFLSSRAQREETNLKHARARLERRGPEGRRLLQLYRRVRQGKPVPDQPTSPLFAQLKLAGVVKATDEGRLTVRNRIYEKVFSPEWAKAAMPADRGFQFAVATLAATLVGFLVWYAVFLPRAYEEILRSATRVDAYNVAFEAFSALRVNPFSRSLAADLMQEFWEQRALRYALAGARDESLLCYLKGLELRDDQGLRRQAGNLVGSDYEGLRLTLWHESGARSWRTDKVRTLVSLIDNRPLAVAFSPDGHVIATGSSVAFGIEGVRLWDAHSGEPLAPPVAHRQFGMDSVNALAFSPDGHMIAAAGEVLLNGTARLWDAHSGRPIGSPFELKWPVNSVAFSPDNRTIAAGSGEPLEGGGTVRFWDTRSGEPLMFQLEHEKPVNGVAFSPDGKIVATVAGYLIGAGGIASLWDAGSGKPIAPPLQLDGSGDAVAISPDGRLIAISAEGTVQFRGAAFEELGALPLQHGRDVHAVAFSPDGRLIATGTRDGIVQLWDASSKKPLAPSLLHQGRIKSVTFSPDSRILAVGAGDATARLWNAHAEKPIETFFRSQETADVVALSLDGRTVAAGARDGTVRLWEARTGKLLVPPLLHKSYVSAVAFSPNGRMVAAGSGDNTARLWDAHSGKLLVPPLLHKSYVSAVAFSPDGRTLATRASDDLVRLWDARTGKLLTQQPLQLQGVSETIAFHPNGKYFFVATDQWLSTFSWDGTKAVPQSSQLLHGIWKDGFRFPSDCEDCLEVALGDTGNSFHLETLQLDGPTDPPIEGDPKALLDKWQARLGLKFDGQMRPVPR